MQSTLEASCRQHQQLIGCYSGNKKQTVLTEQSKSPALKQNSSGKKKIQDMIQEENSCLTTILPMFCQM